MDNEEYLANECIENKLAQCKRVNVKEEECCFPKSESLKSSLKNNEDEGPLWPKCSIIGILDFSGTYEERRKLSTNSDIASNNDANDNIFKRKRSRKNLSTETYMNERHTSRDSREENRSANESAVTHLSPPCLCANVKTCNRLIKLVERFESKIGKLQSSVDEIVEKLNLSETSMHYNSNVLQPQLPHFPLYTNDALDDLEEELSDAEFRNILINELRKLGGKRVSDLVNKQMSYLMDFSLGCRYSYYGTKEKMAFCVLKLYSVIADVVRLFFPTTTNEELKEPIQTWLRHCKEKCQKRQKLEIS